MTGLFAKIITNKNSGFFLDPRIARAVGPDGHPWPMQFVACSGTPLRRHTACHRDVSLWPVHSQAACITAPLRTCAAHKLPPPAQASLPPTVFRLPPRSRPSQGLTGRTAIPGRCSLRPAPALRRSGTPLRRYAACHQAYSLWQAHSLAACITAPLRTYAPPRLRRPQTAPTRPGVPAPFSLSLRSYFLISINTPSPANQVKPVASVGCENLGWVVCNWKW